MKVVKLDRWLSFLTVESVTNMLNGGVVADYYHMKKYEFDTCFIKILRQRETKSEKKQV